MDILLEYLIKDFIPARSASEDHSKFTDARCEKITVSVDRVFDCVVVSDVQCGQPEEFTERNEGLHHLYSVSRVSGQQHVR